MMNKIFHRVAGAIALFTVLVALATTSLLGLAQPALADGDLAVGAKVFTANCAACHANGTNVVMAPKNLKKESLEKFSMNSEDAIATQVRNGKNAMPAFGNKLSDEQISAVAAYVIAQADKGWQK
jgi:cytochrome c6